LWFKGENRLGLAAKIPPFYQADCCKIPAGHAWAGGLIPSSIIEVIMRSCWRNMGIVDLATPGED
jgi:hypothetical protein